MNRERLTTTSTIFTINNLSLTNFNPLANVSPLVLASIKQDAEHFVNTLPLAKKIWNQFRKVDLNNEGVSMVAAKQIFQLCKEQLHQLLKIKTLTEFMQAFDRDNDKILNQDQQLSVLLILKERMQEVADMLLKIQQYHKYKILMRELRNLEGLITGWQDQIRSTVHKRQLKVYKEIGVNKIDLFFAHYEARFKELESYKAKIRANWKTTFQRAKTELQTKMSSSTVTLKVKPIKKMKEYQFQEKLLSLQERVEQALDLRKQLNDLQKRQADRIDSILSKNQKLQYTKLQKRYQKQLKLIELRLNEEQSKLIIKMREDYDILKKKTKLHENEIKRIQGLQRKWFNKLGNFQPQLKRQKKLSKSRNQILSLKRGGAKEIVRMGTDAEFDRKKTINQRSKAVRFIDQIFKKQQISQFSLNKLNDDELPVNIGKNFRKGNFSVQKYLQGKKREDFESKRSLCDLYDQQLNEVEQVLKHSSGTASLIKQRLESLL